METGDIAQWVMVFAMKPGKLNWTPRIHVVDRKKRTDWEKLSFSLHICVTAHIWAQVHTISEYVKYKCIYINIYVYM